MPPDSQNAVPPTEDGGKFDTKYVIFNGRLYYICECCQVRVEENNKKSWYEHLMAKKHLRNAAVLLLQNKSSMFTNPKKTGLAVSVQNDMNSQSIVASTAENFIKIEMDLSTKVFDEELQVKFQNVSNIPLKLLGAKFLTTHSQKFVQNCISFSISSPVHIPAAQEIKLSLKCQFNVLCHSKLPLSILLQKQDSSLQYYALAYFTFVATSQTVKRLAPKELYKRTRNSRRNCLAPEPYRLVRGERLPEEVHAKLERIRKLGQYTVPKQLRLLAMKNFQDSAIEDRLKDALKALNTTLQLKTSNLATHNSKFHNLLWIEEMQQEVNIRNYDIESIGIEQTGGNLRRPQYKIKVAGLAEGRPSVLRGDWIYLTPTGQSEWEFEGVVHHVNLDSLVVSFVPRFQAAGCGRPHVQFRVRFSFNRITLQLQHRAIQLTNELKLAAVVFPTRPTTLPLATAVLPESISLYDKKLLKNEEQLRAVKFIVAGQYRPAPYIIFGPPGTGKTSTLIEAAKQTLHLNSSARLLLCAPSNNAADLLAQRLLNNKGVNPKQIYRMHALCRPMQSVPNDVLKVSNLYNSVYGSKTFDFPEKATFGQYRVIVTTLATAGRLVSAEFNRGFFTHVFIDEAGQATEPEALIAIAGIIEPSAASNTHVVLAGDCKQLGPVLQSILAAQCGLGISLLERLMTEVELYQRGPGGESGVPGGGPGTPSGSMGPYNSQYITKLLKNYRSHPDIFAVSSRLFYDNELIACADKNERESLCDWKELPTKGVPLIVHGVIGEDKREQNSPSYFNPIEIIETMGYVDKLIDQGRCKAKDIGIIAPYRKQVDKFRQIIRHNKQDKYEGMMVGSVEEFQGQERLVIIITTVRSSENLLATDRDFKLGFVSNEKRFNTALTRAKALTILIGNPLVLCTDPNWRAFIKFGYEKGAYIGLPLSPSLLDENASEPDIDQLTTYLGEMQVADFEAVAEIVESETPLLSAADRI